MSSGRRVGVVTGGGGGIGAAIAEQLGREGWFVVTVDPLVTVDGSERVTDQPETTADRIVAAGGHARASSLSVTDGPALRSLFEGLVAEHGRIDAVVNVAGISRPTAFGRGREEDWRAVLEVHLDGYLNVLAAALPVMAAAGRGRIVGVTSGSGWRAADAGAYSRAKRAVACLTWQLGRVSPPGVTVNALSPIAATRMVMGALSRAGTGGSAKGGQPAAASTGGLSLASVPDPGDIGPIGSYMAGDGLDWANGRVLFAAGSEVALIAEPHLIEVVGTEGPAPLTEVLGGVLPGAFVPAEAHQASQGGSNARFRALFSAPADAPAAPAPPGGGEAPVEPDGGSPAGGGPVRVCAIVSDLPQIAGAVAAALGEGGVACHRVDPVGGFEAATDALRTGAHEPVDAVVVALSGPAQAGGPDAAQAGDPAAAQAGDPAAGWTRILAEHRGLVDALHTDSAWAFAAAGYAGTADRPVRLVTLTDATTAGGRSRAQAAAQAARVAASSTKGRVTAFAVAVESPESRAAGAVGPLVAHLLLHSDGAGLAGAELAVGDGWIGLRRHPAPAGSVSYGGPALPAWLGPALHDIVGEGPREAP